MSTTAHALLLTDADRKTWIVAADLGWGDAQDQWLAADDARRAGTGPVGREAFYSVRSMDDPMVAAAEPLPTIVKLDRVTRNEIVRATRRMLRTNGYESGWGLDDARDFAATMIEETGRFWSLEFALIADYAHGIACFCCPTEARN